MNSTLDAGAESAAPAIETGRVSGSLTVRHSTIAADTGILVDSADSAVSWSATDVPVDPESVEDVEGNRFDLASLGLGQLAENGGPAYLSGVALLTRVPDASSPLVDAGQQPTPAAAPASDERGAGFDRVSDGRIDIGAIEVQPADPTLPATGGTVPRWLVIAGVIVLVAGAALLIISRLRRRS